MHSCASCLGNSRAKEARSLHGENARTVSAMSGGLALRSHLLLGTAVMTTIFIHPGRG